MDVSKNKILEDSKSECVNFSYMLEKKKTERNLEIELLLMNSNNLYCTYRSYNKFFIRGQTINDFYIVTIGPQECTCTKEGLPLCEHLLFVMVKILAKRELIKHRTLNLKEIEKTFGLPGEFRSLQAYITESTRDNTCVVCTRKVSRSSDKFIQCNDCKSMIHSTCYDMCTDQSFRLGVDSRCPSCKKQIFLVFEKALLLEIQDAVSSINLNHNYLKWHSEFDSLLIGSFIFFKSNGLKEYGLRKLKSSMKDQLKISDKQHSTKKYEEIIKVTCEILNSLMLQSVDISLYNLICETLTDLIWYCNCRSMLYFDIIRPLIIIFLRKCSDSNKRIREYSMDVLKSLAFTNVFHHHQKGKFIDSGLLYICSFIKFVVGMSNKLLASCFYVSMELIEEIIENFLEENENLMYNISAFDQSLKILGEFCVDVLQYYDVYPTVFADTAHTLLLKIKQVNNSQYLDDVFLSNKQKAKDILQKKSQTELIENYSKHKPLNENVSQIPKVPPRDKSYRKVLHKTFDDQNNIEKFDQTNSVEELQNQKRIEAKLKRSNVYSPSDQSLIILPKEDTKFKNHPMFDHIVNLNKNNSNNCIKYSRRSLSHDDTIVSKLECSVKDLKVCQVSAETQNNFCLNFKKDENKCVYRTHSQENNVSKTISEKPIIFHESKTLSTYTARDKPMSENTIEKTFVGELKIPVNELGKQFRDGLEINCTSTSSSCNQFNLSARYSNSTTNSLKANTENSMKSAPADISCLPCSTINKVRIGEYDAEVTEPYHCLSEEQVICPFEGEITYSKGSYDENIDWIRKECVGQGQFADCFKAADVRSGRNFCVKKIKCSLREEKECSVIKEVHIMRKMKHKNIIKFMGVTKQVDHMKYCLFLELCVGSIVNKRKIEGKFADSQMRMYLSQLFDAVSYIHSKGIIHRDIKGKNILISMKDEIKICDFGAAAVLSSTETITNEFKNEMIGTPPFLAPEIVRGNHYGRNVDVWGTGCVIIELFTGNHPWYKSGCSYTVQQVIFMIGTSKKPPSIPRKMNWKLQSLCRACLVLDQPFRPTARELLNHTYFNNETSV